MGMPLTLGLMAFFIALFAYGSWVANRPANPLKPRMIPWRLVIILSGFAAIIMLVHVVNLLGVETGGQTR